MLLSLSLSCPLLICKTCSHLLLHLIAHQIFILSVFTLLLLSDDITGKSVHEILSSLFALLEFMLSISFLFVKQLCILSLSHNISFLLLLFSFLSFRLVFFIFMKHFLQIVSFLPSFFGLHGLLHVHLITKSLYQFNLLCESFFFFSAFSGFLFFELSITALLFLHDFFTNSRSFFLLTLSKKFDVL